MSVKVRNKKFRPALKHGAYSTTALLPGEDAAAFKKLHQGVIAELNPNGPLEEETVADIARLVWRKQNLGTFRIAERARQRWSAILSEKMPYSDYPLLDFLAEQKIDPAVREAAYQSAEAQARAELGPEYDLARMEKTATVEHLNGRVGGRGAIERDDRSASQTIAVLARSQVPLTRAPCSAAAALFGLYESSIILSSDRTAAFAMT